MDIKKTLEEAFNSFAKIPVCGTNAIIMANGLSLLKQAYSEIERDEKKEEEKT